MLQKELNNISEQFIIKKQKADWILQVQMTQSREGVYRLSQELYVEKVLERFGMRDCNGCKTLSEVELLPRGDDDEKADAHVYRSGVASLIYLSEYTRPDLKYIVGRLAQFQMDPAKDHMDCFKRVLRYLKATKHYGLNVDPNKGDLRMDIYTDANWCTDKTDRKSISGVVILLNGVPVIWKSKKQRVSALSTCEAELYAAVLGMVNAIYLNQVIEELGFKVKQRVLWIDNEGTIATIKKQQNTERTKHIDIRNHFIRDLYADGFMEVRSIATSEQVADCMTKPLGRILFEKFRGILNVC
jgi:hypothetical protein